MNEQRQALRFATVALWVVVASCSDASDGDNDGGAGHAGASSGAAGAVSGASSVGSAGRASSPGGSSGSSTAVGGGRADGGATVGAGGVGAGGAAGGSAFAGTAGQTTSGQAHCVAKADAPCVSTSTDCALGSVCVDGACVPGPVAGDPALGTNHDQCAHGFYATPATHQVCTARAPQGTVGCSDESPTSSDSAPHCQEEFPCEFDAISGTSSCSGLLGEADLCGAPDSNCMAGLDCIAGPGNVTTFRCRARLGVGSLCGDWAIEPGNCVPGSHCVPGDDVGTTCAAYPGLGQACEDDNCGPGLTCLLGQCVSPASVGAACDPIACDVGLVCINSLP